MKASVIIPALNEAPTIADVVTAAKAAPSVREVIVVSDGSRDGTAAVARWAGADVVIELPRRVGKGGAVMIGVEQARGEVIILLDGDLIGLQPQHVERLMDPLLRDGTDMVVGVFRKDLMQSVLPSLSGQRAIRRTLLFRHPGLRDVGFGLERTLATIARRERWCVRMIKLTEVSHRLKEEKYGLVRGYQAKLRMAEELLVRRSRVRQRTGPRVLAALVVLLMAHGLSGVFVRQSSAAHLPQMPAPTSADRILLVVAHNDDEVIAAGGYLTAALEAGSQVTVVILTNGDGNKFSAAVLTRRLRPKQKDFIREGQIRQQESLAALSRLGISPGRVIFMGFPDRGLQVLLAAHWSKLHPYTSPFTKASSPPYPGVYRSTSRYAGEDLLENLIEIINAARPTLILTHSALDEHPDHKATYAFVTQAMNRTANRSFGQQPTLYTFLIHANDFPRPLRYTPQSVLMPPSRLRESGEWRSFSLTSAQAERKRKAAQAYRSQYESPYLRLLLNSFIRRNELFLAELPPPD